jgi:TPR repeat protein
MQRQAYYLGQMLEDGWPIREMYRSDPARRVSEALKWYEVAGRSNSPFACFACFRLGLMYDEGRGVPQALDKALHWYECAAKLGYSPAREQISVLRARMARH